MSKSKRQCLEEKGWKTGTVADLLGLTPEESAYVEMKLALSENAKHRRERENLTQSEMARRMGSSQSRIAKIEAGDPTVSLDLLVRYFIALGATPGDLARVIARSGKSATA